MTSLLLLLGLAWADDSLDVLILDDGGEETADLVTLLEGQGHSVTCSCDDGLLESDFDGTPYALAGHDVVIWLDGDLSRDDEDMPAAGQQDLVAWVEAGGGLVHYAATIARFLDDGENQDAEELMLLDGSDLTLGTADFEVIDGGSAASGTLASGDTFQILGLAMVASDAGLGSTVVKWAPGSQPEGPYEAVVLDDLDDGRIAQLGWFGHVGAGWSSNLDYTNASVALLLPGVIQAVARRPPDVDAGGPYAADPGDFVLVSGSATDHDGGDVTCAWDLDEDGLEDTAEMLTTWDASASDGPLDVTLALSCTDDEGAEATATASLTVANLPPEILSVEIPSPAEEGVDLALRVEFEDPEPADTHRISWTLGDGTTLEGQAITHSYAEDGSYTVEVTVTDDDGDSDARSFAWTVHNQAPTVVLEGEQAALVGESLLFRCTAIDPGGDPLTLSWDLGDGRVAGDVEEVEHAYLEAGTYTVGCTADDGQELTTVSLDVAVTATSVNAAPGTPELMSPWNGEVVGAAVTVRIRPVADPEGTAPLLDVAVTDAWTGATAVSLTGVAQGAVETAIALPVLEEGSYRWQVRAIDGDGLAGAWSDAWYFAVQLPVVTSEGPYGCACAGTGRGTVGGLWLLLFGLGVLLSRRSGAGRSERRG